MDARIVEVLELYHPPHARRTQRARIEVPG